MISSIPPKNSDLFSDVSPAHVNYIDSIGDIFLRHAPQFWTTAVEKKLLGNFETSFSFLGGLSILDAHPIFFTDQIITTLVENIDDAPKLCAFLKYLNDSGQNYHCYLLSAVNGYGRGELSEFIEAFYLLQTRDYLKNFSIDEILDFFEDSRKACALFLILKNPESERRPELFAKEQRGELTEIIRIFSKNPNSLSPEELPIVERFAQDLPNRQLQGNRSVSLQDVVRLDPKEIDLARAAFIVQQPMGRQTMQQYEAALDLRALQILSRYTRDTVAARIERINQYLFRDLGCQFEEGDHVGTLLHEVITRGTGVCAGLSLLYVSIAQRLSLPLQLVVLPTHIYPRHVDESGNVINIETTAGGALFTQSIQNNYRLKILNLKEAIAVTLRNLIDPTVKLDPKRAPEMMEMRLSLAPNDRGLLSDLGIQYILVGRFKEGREMFTRAVRGSRIDEANRSPVITVAEDYLAGVAGDLAISYCFTSSKNLCRETELKSCVNIAPQFRRGLKELADYYFKTSHMREYIETARRYFSCEYSSLVSKYRRVCGEIEGKIPHLEPERLEIGQSIEKIRRQVSALNSEQDVEAIQSNLIISLGRLAEFHDQIQEKRPNP